MIQKRCVTTTIAMTVLLAAACGPATGPASTLLSPVTGSASPTPTPKPDPILQNKPWIKTYGDGNISLGGDVIQTDDGGFLIVGSIGGNPGNDLQGGVLLIKTGPDGEIVWQKVYGGEEYDAGWSIIETNDGGYLIAGETASFGAGGMDGYLIKVDRDGNEIWSNTYGSPLNETIISVSQTVDGGYLLVGNSIDPNDVIADPGTAGYVGFAGRSNIYLVKTDPDGNEAWSRIVQSDNNVLASSGQVTPDGGLVILATIVYYPEFDNDLYLLKVDDAGNEIWSRIWEEGSLSGYAMTPTSDNCLVITGAHEDNENTPSDVLLLKVDLQGNELWRATYGEPDLYEQGSSVIETFDGNYLVLASSTYSLYTGKSDINLVLFDANGTLLWMEPITSRYDIKAQTILQLPEGGYIITGSVINVSVNTYKAVLIKTDADGHVQE